LIIPKSKCKHILVALVLSGTTPTQCNYTYTEAMHVLMVVIVWLNKAVFLIVTYSLYFRP